MSEKTEQQKEEAALKQLTEAIAKSNDAMVEEAKKVAGIVGYGSFSVSDLKNKTQYSFEQAQSAITRLKTFGLIETLVRDKTSIATLYKIRFDKQFRLEYLSRRTEELLASVGENDILMNIINPPAENTKIN